MMEDIRKFLKECPKPWVVIMVGPPLSGKDSLIRELNLDDVHVISRDQILIDLHCSGDYNLSFISVDKTTINNELINQMTYHSSNGDNVIVNMTNVSSKVRKSNLRYFGGNYKKIAITFPILELDEYGMRNVIRSRSEKKDIPLYVIKNMIDRYEVVSEEEGFDKIITVDLIK